MLTQRETFETGLLKYAPFREQHALKFAEAMRKAKDGPQGKPLRELLIEAVRYGAELTVKRGRGRTVTFWRRYV